MYVTCVTVRSCVCVCACTLDRVLRGSFVVYVSFALLYLHALRVLVCLQNRDGRGHTLYKHQMHHDDQKACLLSGTTRLEHLASRTATCSSAPRSRLLIIMHRRRRHHLRLCIRLRTTPNPRHRSIPRPTDRDRPRLHHPAWVTDHPCNNQSRGMDRPRLTIRIRITGQRRITPRATTRGVPCTRSTRNMCAAAGVVRIAICLTLGGAERVVPADAGRVRVGGGGTAGGHNAIFAEHALYMPVYERASKGVGRACMQYDPANITRALAYVHAVRSKTSTDAREQQGLKLLGFIKEVFLGGACVCERALGCALVVDVVFGTL